MTGIGISTSIGIERGISTAITGSRGTYTTPKALATETAPTTGQGPPSGNESTKTSIITIETTAALEIVLVRLTEST